MTDGRNAIPPTTVTVCVGLGFLWSFSAGVGNWPRTRAAL